MSPPEEGSKPSSTKSKFVHVPMYQVSYDHQQKGSTSRNTSRHKVRWIFGYASYDALKKKCVGDECRHEEHELEFHLTSTSEGNKKYRILHNGRILIEEIKEEEEHVSEDSSVLFQHDFTIRGKNHDAKLVILSEESSIKPKLSFGGLPFEDLPQTHEIQRNILSLYVAVPRKEKSKKKATNDYHTLLEEEDEINSRKEEERQQRRKEKKHRSKGENRRASTGNKMMFAHMTQNKEPTLHKLLDGDGTPQPATVTSMASRAKSETNQRLGFMGDGTRTAIDDDDDDEESETAEEPPTTKNDEPELDDEALTEQMIEQSLFLAEDQIDHSGEHEQEYWEDGRPKVGRSSSFASISSVGSSCSTVMDGTDSDDDTKNDGSVYLDRSTRSMFDSSTDSSSAGEKQSAARGSQAGASSAPADDNDDDASISTAGSSVVGKMAELNVDDMLIHLINDSDDDSSDDDEDDKKKSGGGIPASIKI